MAWINHVRRGYNAIDSIFDRRVLKQAGYSVRELKSVEGGRTARQAFDPVLKIAREWDPDARLKLITAPDGLQPNGAAYRWEFFFDLVNRRGKLECDWISIWDAAADRFTSVRIETKAQPFPPIGSKLNQMVTEGQLLYRQLSGLWRDEWQRTPDLPPQFRESDSVVQALSAQGVDLRIDECSLSTGLDANGQPSWVVQTRAGDYHFNFT